MTQVVFDAKLGEFARRQNDWFRRVREGSLDPDAVNEAMQAVIKGEFNNFAFPHPHHPACSSPPNIILTV